MRWPVVMQESIRSEVSIRGSRSDSVGRFCIANICPYWKQAATSIFQRCDRTSQYRGNYCVPTGFCPDNRYGTDMLELIGIVKKNYVYRAFRELNIAGIALFLTTGYTKSSKTRICGYSDRDSSDIRICGRSDQNSTTVRVCGHFDQNSVIIRICGYCDQNFIPPCIRV